MTTEYFTESEKHIYNSFKDLRFNEEKHLYSRYKNGHLIYLPSVSSRVEGHCYKFNKNMILRGGSTLIEASAAAESKRRGQEVSVEQLDAEWRKKNEDACILGSNTHKFLETYTGIQRPSTPQEEAGIKYIKSLAGKYRISFRELRVYSREFDYAGTMDLPLEVIGDTSYIIDDYKTNGDLFKFNDYMKPPFDYMEASPYNKYQLQLSYYQIPLEEIGIRISNRRLVYLKPTGEYTIFPLQDMTEELKDYLKTRKHEY